MAWGARWYLVGSVVLGILGVLAGCSGGGFFVEREPWRREAEVACLNAGTVKEGGGVVRVTAIRGPGVCGADFPLKVSILGGSAPLGYTDDPRPPAAIPGNAASVAPRWPIVKPGDAPAAQNFPAPNEPRARQAVRIGPPRASGYPSSGTPEQPVSLNPPGVAEGAGAGSYDFRKPYGASLPARARGIRPQPDSPRDDFSPEPYERRPLVDAPADAPSRISRAPLRDATAADGPRASTGAVLPGDIARARESQPSVVPLASSQGLQMPAGATAPVGVSPAATLACPLVSELDRWIANAVQPAAMRWFGAPVAEIKQISAYSCRGMNGNPNAKISEHAFGNALDIAAFILADGRIITVKGGWNGLPEEQGFLRDVQGAACDQFTTVLAPGSNAYHYDHIHVDLMQRHSGYRACNPHAVSGEEVAARAGAKYAARRGGEPNVTGTLAHRRLPSPPRRLRSEPDDEEPRQRALPMAQPGEDGEDD